jgi:hypothetical protein
LIPASAIFSAIWALMPGLSEYRFQPFDLANNGIAPFAAVSYGFITNVTRILSQIEQGDPLTNKDPLEKSEELP